MSEAEGQQPPAEQQLPTYMIEGARSSRSRCKTCRRKIDKGALRLGILIEGPYGVGYMWHHLNCAARRQFDRVREAYREEAWLNAKEPPSKLPSLEALEVMQQKAEEKRRNKKDIPYVEIDPSGRAKCKHCGEPMEKGSVRAVLGRGVYFGNQVRVAPITVHPRCVAAELEKDDCETEVEGLIDAMRANSGEFDPALFAAAVADIGELPEGEPQPAAAGETIDIKPDI
ncbi:MAG: hypothetical protein GTN89_10355 [Acidobacteria bacterium]|nr:hypothetical protein [Acidobacteriota bacterium]NIM64206.1 hypothetical protein [Acidobacteriota bacterium]NIO59658.1 hypothetical protein [Acidobacteriota bacterium]NIQ30752.1 hypothetical protein [Acidobacteriota bacterium]NIQ85779.1 hypothetical protein [Acidobacteriota bacterium]